MITAVENRARTPAVASAAQGASRTATPLRVVTNASLGAREQLRALAFAVQVLDAAALNGPSAANIDADIVVVDCSLAGMWNPLNTQKVNAPVVFINGLALPQADYGSDVIDGSIDADSSLIALKLAAIFAECGKAAPAEAGMTCGNLKLTARGLLERRRSQSTIGEYKIVALLASRPGDFFTYRAIYDRLRHEGFVAGEGRGPLGQCAIRHQAHPRQVPRLDPAFDGSRTIPVSDMAGASRADRYATGTGPG